MHYTLHQLQVFLQVTQSGSVTRAAEELHLSQPAVSIQLRNFQSQFDIPLTEIIGRKLYVTEFGREIADAAERILNEVYAINYKTMTYQGLLTGRLRISSVSTGKYIMPYYLSGFLQRHPGIELVMDVTNKSRVVESLRANESDFCLVSLLPEDLDVEALELLENKLCLVDGSNRKWGRRRQDPSVMETMTMLYREEGSGTRTSMEAFLRQHNVRVKRKLELTSNEAVKQAVIAGLGCSIMPMIGIRRELDLGELQVVPVLGLPIRTQWRLIWPRRKTLSPVASAFAAYLRDHRKEVNAQWFG
ncbi:MAG: LysR substrate-binding domain-containing protein [Flavobacteriales bacterium]|jgi:DNA-binding transcriptional LysR family regulator